MLTDCEYFNALLDGNPELRSIELPDTFKWSSYHVKWAFECIYHYHDSLLYKLQQYKGSNICEVFEAVGDESNVDGVVRKIISFESDGGVRVESEHDSVYSSNCVVDCHSSKASASKRINLLYAYEVLHYFQCSHYTSIIEEMLKKFILILLEQGLIPLVNLCADYTAN